MPTSPKSKAKDGFTLIELLIAIALIVVVTGIVYSSFFSVAESTEIARVAAEEVRLRQFLVRNLRANLSQAYGDWRPGASLRRPLEDLPDPDQPVPDQDELLDEGFLDSRFWMEGIDDSSADGPADSLTFATTAPLTGARGLPGVIKQIRYEIVDANETEEGPVSLDYNSRQLMLECTETPIFEVADLEGRDDIDGFVDQEDLLGDIDDYEAPGWSVPISTMDIVYFDGEDWIDEWDSIAEGRLPWAIHFRINFARPEDGDDFSGFDATEDPDLSLIVPIPAGMGVTEAPIEPIHRPGDDGPHPHGGQGEGDGIRQIRPPDDGNNP